MKLCRGCGKLKELTEFRVDNSRKDGRQSRCKTCKGKQEKEILPSDVKRCSKCKKVKHLDEFHKDKTTSSGYASRCKNCIARYQEQYRETNKGLIQQRKQIDYQAHKESRQATIKAYYQQHKEDIQAYKAQWAADKRAVDVNVRIGESLRSNLRGALKTGRKVGSAIKDLGCSIDELKQHLEKQFYPHPDTDEAMTWENYGLYGWHIDHVEPLDSFELTNREQFLKACHYTNLQPLWAIHNLSKGARLGWKKE